MNPAGEVFVGRAPELAVGARLLQRARAGRPTALLLTGEPGIGKTSVLARLRGDAERSGFRTIAIDADRVDAGMPYAALRLALEPLLGDEHDPSLMAAATLLGETLTGRAGPPSAQRVHDLLRAVVEGWAFRSPVLLTVDDLHDADDGTAASVLHLIEHGRGHRVQVIATSRPAPALGPGVGTVLAALRRTGRLEAVALTALSTDDVTELVHRRTGLEPTARLVELLAERSGRTPFFLIELLDAMTRSGDLTTIDGTVDAARHEPVALPSRVTTAVVHRVFGLGRDARAIAAAVAVSGSLPPDPVALLVAVTGMAGPRVAAALDALVEARLIGVEAGRTRFVHAIARDAVYDDIGPAARRRWHGRVAAALAALPAGHVDDVEIAGHVLRATSGHDAAAAHRLSAAGRAVVGSDPGAAADWYRAALAHLGPQEPAVAAIQLALAEALLLSGRHDEATRLALAVLAATADAPTRIAAIATAARAMVNNGAGSDAVELLERAALTPDLRTPAVLLMLAQALAWTNRRGDALTLATEARGSGDRDEQALADVLGLYVAIADGAAATVAQLADGLDVVEPRLSPGTRVTSRLARCVAGAFELDPADGLAIAAGVDDAAPLAEWFAAVAAWARYRQGRYAEIPLHGAVRRAEGCDGRLASGLRVAASLAAHVERDDPRAAELADAAAAASPVPVFATTVDVARAMWHRRRGEHEAASVLLAACAAREEASGHVNLQALVLAHLVDAAVDRGDGAAAYACADRLQTLAGRGGVATTMHVLLARAVAYDDLAAARAALDHATRHQLGADAGRARGLVGALTGDPGELTAAYRELGSLGAVWRQRAVAHELRRRGHRVPHGPAGPGDLSPVEVEVVSLVAAGLTNRQIAARMALSPKTVEVYLSRIYVKTGSRSRVELAVAARQSRAIAAARWASTST